MLIALTIFNSFLMVLGQVLWKCGVMHKNINSLSGLLLMFLNPFIIAGILVYVFATGLWIYILNKGELSYVYPIQSVAFVLTMLVGVFLFRESLTTSKVVGTLVIILGVITLTRR